jgi:hypothetical protein
LYEFDLSQALSNSVSSSILDVYWVYCFLTFHQAFPQLVASECFSALQESWIQNLDDFPWITKPYWVLRRLLVADHGCKSRAFPVVIEREGWFADVVPWYLDLLGLAHESSVPPTIRHPAKSCQWFLWVLSLFGTIMNIWNRIKPSKTPTNYKHHQLLPQMYPLEHLQQLRQL